MQTLAPGPSPKTSITPPHGVELRGTGRPQQATEGPALLADDCTATSTTEMMLKDVGLALATSEETGATALLAAKLEDA